MPDLDFWHDPPRSQPNPRLFGYVDAPVVSTRLMHLPQWGGGYLDTWKTMPTCDQSEGACWLEGCGGLGEVGSEG